MYDITSLRAAFCAAVWAHVPSTDVQTRQTDRHQNHTTMDLVLLSRSAFCICWWFTLSVCLSVGVDCLPFVCVACLTPHANIRLWVHELSEAVARGRPARLQHWCVGAAAPSGGRLPGVVRSFVLRSPHEHLPPPAAMPPATAHLTGYQARRRVTWHAQPMRAASISCAHDLITRERHLIHATAD